MKTQFLNKLMLLLIITSTHQVIISSIQAQTPEKMSYQAVIRDSGNKLIQNKTIGIKISILEGSTDGAIIYSESQTPSTNANGLVSIEFGGGAGFNSIKWENGPYFIKTETDPEGGLNYTIMGTSQMLSVPYAIHAKTAENFDEKDPVFNQSVASFITAEDTTYWNGKQDKLIEGEGIKIQNNVISTTGGGPNPGDEGIKVGKYYGGGVVAWVNDEGTRGLILAMEDQSASPVEWSNIPDVSIGSVTGEFFDGLANSNAIVAQTGHSGSAAKLCLDYTNSDYGTGVYSDWYLPSIKELESITPHLMKINFSLINDNNPDTTAPGGSETHRYWSSTEFSYGGAWVCAFNDNSIYSHNKKNTSRVRAIRAF